MKTLDEFNQARVNFHSGLPVKNNIGCPNCSEELYDSQPNVTLTSQPPQKEVHCERCGYRGYRYE